MVFNQPKTAFFIVFTQMWESFSYYGMRALLVLYLINELGHKEMEAFAIYALYISMVELTAFFGGYVADSFIGLKRAILLGAGLIALGQFSLTASESAAVFYFGLGCVIGGSSLFRCNLKALLGMQYQENDPKREAGFTLFYTSINFGGFIAALLCGYAAEYYGWPAGFCLAALGMIIGMAVFIFGINNANIQGVSSPSKISWPFYVTVSLILSAGLGCLLSQFHISQKVLFPLAIGIFIFLMISLGRKMQRREALFLGYLLGILIIYFTFHGLMGSMLLIFCERNVEMMLFGKNIPCAALSATDPFTIMLLGPILGSVLSRFPLTLKVRITLSFSFLSLAFGIFYHASFITNGSIVNAIASFACIAIGELFLAPSVYAYCSSVAPLHAKGLTMGLVSMAFCVANFLTGAISQTYDSVPISDLFFGITILSSAIFILLLSYCIISKSKSRQTSSSF